MNDTYTAEAAVALVGTAIKALQVGPETVIAADPASATVDWDMYPVPARRSKMFHVRAAVMSELAGVIHQLPQVYLVAEDGVVVTLFGTEYGRLVMLTGVAARGKSSPFARA